MSLLIKVERFSVTNPVTCYPNWLWLENQWNQTVLQMWNTTQIKSCDDHINLHTNVLLNGEVCGF